MSEAHPAALGGWRRVVQGATTCWRGVVQWILTRWDKSPWAFNAGGAVLAMAVGMAAGLEGIPGWNTITLIWGSVGLLAAVLLIAGPYLLARRAQRVASLQDRIQHLESVKDRIDQARERDSADLRSVVDRVGRRLLRECGLETDDTRISVYQHHRHEAKFALVGRTSSNPQLSGRGRAAYPDNAGIIAQAWQKQIAHDRNWFTDTEKWVDRQVRNHGMDYETAKGIRMKSLSYLGVRIDDDEVPVGILVMESTDRDRITVKHADDVREHPEFGKLQVMLRAAPKLPLEDPKDAAEALEATD